MVMNTDPKHFFLVNLTEESIHCSRVESWNEKGFFHFREKRNIRENV
jgi:hypothetical protein